MAELIGKRVQRLRERLGLTRTDLASRVGLSSQAIAALESGKSKQPSFLVGLRLAEVLRVPPYELAGLTKSTGYLFRAGNEKVGFGLTVLDSDSAKSTAEWRRQIVAAIASIPGIVIEGPEVAEDPVEQSPPSLHPALREALARMTKSMDRFDRRLRALEAGGQRVSPAEAPKRTAR